MSTSSAAGTAKSTAGSACTPRTTAMACPGWPRTPSSPRSRRGSTATPRAGPTTRRTSTLTGTSPARIPRSPSSTTCSTRSSDGSSGCGRSATRRSSSSDPGSPRRSRHAGRCSGSAPTSAPSSARLATGPSSRTCCRTPPGSSGPSSSARCRCSCCTTTARATKASSRWTPLRWRRAASGCSPSPRPARPPRSRGCAPVRTATCWPVGPPPSSAAAPSVRSSPTSLSGRASAGSPCLTTTFSARATSSDTSQAPSSSA